MAKCVNGYRYSGENVPEYRAIVREVCAGLGAVPYGTPAGRDALAASEWVSVADPQRDAQGMARKVARMIGANKVGPVLIGASVEISAGHSGAWGALRVVGYRFQIDAATGAVSDGVKLGDLTATETERDCGCVADVIGLAGVGVTLADVPALIDAVKNFVAAIIAADAADAPVRFMLQTAVHNPARGGGLTYRDDLAEMADQCAATGAWDLAGTIRATV